jgi:hypothetical protein
MKQERPIIDSPLLEVAEILALGFLRLREKQSALKGEIREVQLDFPRKKSVRVLTSNNAR